MKSNGHKVRIGKLSEFRPQSANANKHTERGLRMLDDAMSEDGYVAPMTAVADSEIIDGSARLERAFDKFSDEAIILEHDGTKPIITVRTDIPNAKTKEAQRIAVRANRIAEADLEWDADILQTIDTDILEGLFSDKELNEILSQTGVEPKDAEPQIDKAEELRQKWGTETGQLWVIGSHRLLVGDATNKTDVGHLVGNQKAQGVITSPPYAEQREDQYGGVPLEGYIEWWGRVQSNLKPCLTADGSLFLNIKPHCENGERVLYVFDLVLSMSRVWSWKFVDEFCWTHPGYPGGWDNRFKNGFEPIYHFAVSQKVKFRPSAVLGDSDRSFDYDRDNDIPNKTGSPFGVNGAKIRQGKARPSNVINCNVSSVTGVEHSAMFPLELPSFFIKAFSDQSDVWLEPFCGGGTTMVAAENLGRTAYCLEIEAASAAVSLERMSTAFPHLKIERVDKAVAA